MAVPSRVGIFIDGPNLSLTLKLLKSEIDYRRILQYYAMRGRVIRAYYFSVVDPEQHYQNIQPLIDWLDYNGFSVVTKSGREFIEPSGRRRLIGRSDVELAVTAMEMADHIDHMVLFTGSSDYRAVVKAMQRKGVSVTVVSTLTTNPPVVADELRRQADEFVDLTTLMPIIGREPSERRRATASAGADFHEPRGALAMEETSEEAQFTGGGASLD